MICDKLMIRFGELNTKGKNKNEFIKALYDNTVLATKDLKSLKYSRTHDRIYISFDESEKEELIKRVKQVSGIANFSLVYSCNNDIDEIVNTCLELVKNESNKTFKVKAHRAYKKFPVHSDDVNIKVATAILKNTNLKVDIHNPDILVSIDIREEQTSVFTSKIEGAGGYPLGIAGKGLVLMSGGIDSPVAAYMAMNRGIRIECIHFASPPYTQEQAKQKVIDLIKVLSTHRFPIKLHIVPFTKLQEEIYKNVEESYAITIMRRMMYRISEKMAKRRNCLCLINGESIGQVSSQTLPSMQVINEVVKIPVIRPLCCMDKAWIMDKAREINTYDISIRPFIDCCTIFTPKNPVTHPNYQKVLDYESKFDYQTLVNDCVFNTKSITIDSNYSEQNIDDLL